MITPKTDFMVLKPPERRILIGMDSIGDILAGRKTEEPREAGIIKRFMMQNFRATPTVMMGQREITIIVKGAALAGALRPRLLELQELCTTDKRLLIRIQ